MVNCPCCDRQFENGHGLRVHLFRKHKDHVSVRVAKPERSHKKKKTVKPAPVISGPNFCPNCGCNLIVVRQALAVAEGITNAG